MGLRELAGLCFALCGAAVHGAPAEVIAAARDGTAYPDVPNDVVEATAYAWQQDLVYAVYGDAVVGLKAGLTSVVSQRRFGVDRPVLGVLPANGAVVDGVVALVPGLKIELEVAFLLGDGPGERAATLPAVELPRLDYVDMRRVAFSDVVASNVAAYRFIVGQPSPLIGDLGALEVKLIRDGTEVARGTGADALGDPRLSAEWMVNKAHEVGYRTQPGWVMLTGALGPVVDAVSGDYLADFGELGTITFRIEEPAPAPAPEAPKTEE